MPDRDRIEALREAVDAADKAEQAYSTYNGGQDQWAAKLRALDAASINFVRDLLDGTWPDKAAVERAVDALIHAKHIQWKAFDRDALRAIVLEILTAALGLTASQGEGR